MQYQSLDKKMLFECTSVLISKFKKLQKVTIFFGLILTTTQRTIEVSKRPFRDYIETQTLLQDNKEV